MFEQRERRKISIQEFKNLYNNQEGSLYLENLDLSDLDLSSFVISGDIREFYIRNVNLENTHITVSLDTKYLSSIHDSNLKGVKFVMDVEAKMNNPVYLYNVILDNDAILKLNEINKLYEKNEMLDGFDLYTLLNNPGLKVSIDSLITALNSSNLRYEFRGVLNQQKIEIFEETIYKILNINETIRKVYKAIENQLDYADKISFFFALRLEEVTFKNMVIDKDMWYFINRLGIKKYHYENVVFDFDLIECDFLSRIGGSSSRLEEAGNVSNVTMPKLKYSDWDKVNISRLATTPITFKKNLYLELGRECNAACSFCRNKCMNDSKYDYDAIVRRLRTIIHNMDSIVIGGGEPTLKNKDLMNLLYTYRDYIMKFYVFSNGIRTVNFNQFLVKELNHNISYYISRHSYDDEINAHILGVNPSSMDSFSDIISNLNNVTLSCTCVKGGVDTPEKIIEYIDRYDYLDIMFCNLMDDASVNMEISQNDGMKISDDIFDEAMNFLKKQGYDYGHEIISTGGYALYVLKRKYNGNVKIIFKKYLTKEQLDEKWPRAMKRTFDLSMAPDGSIYDNWSQSGQKVKKIGNYYGNK